MNFRIGAITARCPACGGSEFEAHDSEPHGAQAPYGCKQCGQRTVYSELIIQIGNEALRQSRETLRALRK